jgi:hypothetical protein
MDETIAIPIAQQTASFVVDFCTFDQRRKETAIQSTVLQFHASLGCQMSSPIRKCTRAARLFTIDNVQRFTLAGAAHGSLPRGSRSWNPRR